MTVKIEDAKREAVPLLVTIAGVSGSGKTFSALLLAAGLAGDSGAVGFLDTENKRGKMYADNADIMKALPKGYKYSELRAPFAPSRYIEHIDAFEQIGCNVLVVDSGSHAWEGDGGCSDIAENNKLRGTPNWIMAKREHKRMMNRLMASPMHIIFCIRAREKIKVLKDANGKDQFVPQGLQPIQEKNFTFEQTLSFMLDEESHEFAFIKKCPAGLRSVFGDEKLLSKEIGGKLKAWVDSGAAVEASDEDLVEQARAFAAQGLVAYQEFWKTITGKQQQALACEHDKNKELARIADDRAKAHEEPSLLGGEAA